MTSSRIVRGTKGRVFVFIVGILLITAIIACYNNTRIQLQDIQKSNEVCHQQQENLSTQLQVIFDYKQRLEKSLKTEKAERQQAKNEYDAKIQQEKLTHEKAISDAKLQYTSLQQHFNLLETEFNDFKEESSKTQGKQLDEMNDLQAKLREVQAQNNKTSNEHQKNVELFKAQIKQLENDKHNLEETIKKLQVENNRELQEENEKLKKEIKLMKEHTMNMQQLEDKKYIKKQETSSKTFSKQSKVNANEYVIDANKSNNENRQSLNVLPVPSASNNGPSPSMGSQKSSTANIGNAAPLKIPIMSVVNKKSTSSSPRPAVDMNQNVLPLPYSGNNKKVPEGVVPVPDKPIEDVKGDERHNEDYKNEIPDEVNAALPGRYRNNIINNEIEQINKNIKEDKVAEEKDTGAHEVFDFPGNEENFDGLEKANQKKEAPVNDKHHIDALGAGDKENVAHGPKIYDGNADAYKDMANDLVEEDDDDAYPNEIHKEPAVRN